MMRKLWSAVLAGAIIMALVSGCYISTPAGAGGDNEPSPQSTDWLRPVEKVVVAAYSQPRGFSFSSVDSTFFYFGNPFFGGTEPSEQEKHKTDLSFAKLEGGHLNWKHSEVVPVKPLFADAIYAGDFVGLDLILIVADKNQSMSHAYQLDRNGQVRFELDMPGIRAQAATVNQSGQVGIIGEGGGNIVWSCINTSFQLICNFALSGITGSPKLITADDGGNFVIVGEEGNNVWTTNVSPHGIVGAVNSVNLGSVLRVRTMTIDADGQVYAGASLVGDQSAIVKFPNQSATVNGVILAAMASFKNSIITLSSNPNLPHGSGNDMAFMRFDRETLVQQGTTLNITSGYPTDIHTSMIRSGTRLFTLSPIAESADTRGAFISMFNLLTGAGSGF